LAALAEDGLLHAVWRSGTSDSSHNTKDPTFRWGIAGSRPHGEDRITTSFPIPRIDKEETSSSSMRKSRRKITNETVGPSDQSAGSPSPGQPGQPKGEGKHFKFRQSPFNLCAPGKCMNGRVVPSEDP
jgi:hypothetical protein